MNTFKHKTLNVIADQPAHEMMETDPDADISLDPTVHCTLLAKSPIQTALSVHHWPILRIAVFVKVTQQRGACICVNGKAGGMDQGCVDDF